MSEQCSTYRKCWNCVKTAVVVIVVMLLIYYFAIARVSHSSKDIEIIDSTKVTIVTQAEFKSKYKDLIPNEIRKRSIPTDSAKIAVIEVVTRPADWEPSEKDILDRLDQFYYNTHDKLLGTLAILLSVFSVLIAFFGGVIPYLRSEKADNQLKEIDAQMKLQADYAKQQLKEIGAKLKESQETATKLNELNSNFCTFKEGYENRIQKLIDTGERIRTRLTKIGDSYFEQKLIDDAAIKSLKEYVNSTDMLETLGENLDGEDYILRARYYQLIKDEAAFQNEFAIWTKLDNTTGPYLAVACTFGAMKIPDKCIEYCDKALVMNPDDSSVWYIKGLALADKCLHEDAIKCFDEALRLQYDDVDALLHKGIAHRMLEHFKEAIECFDMAIVKKPNFVMALFNKGLTLYKLGLTMDAIKCYDDALKINRDESAIWFNKGVILSKTDQTDEAIKCYDEAIRIDPSFVKAYQNKGFILINKNHLEDANKCLDEAIVLDPHNASIWHSKGVALLSDKRPVAAIKCFDEAIRLKPGYTYAWFGNSCCYAMLNMKGMMMESLKTAIRLDAKFKEEAPKDDHFIAYWEDPDFKKLVE